MLWEEKKQRAGELKDRKRGRGDADDGVVDGTKTNQAVRKKAKIRRLRFETVGEDWGETDDDGRQEPVEITLPPPPVIRRRGVKHSLTGTNTISVITDYFSPRPKETEDGQMRWDALVR